MVSLNDSDKEKTIQDLHNQEAESLAQILADRYQLPYIDLSKFSINTDALRIIPEVEARAAQVAAFKVTGKNIFLIARGPQSEALAAVIQDLKSKNYEVNLHLGSEASLERAWSRYPEISQSTKTEAGVIDISNEQISTLLSEITDIDQLKNKLEQEIATTFKQGGVSSLLEVILAGGVATQASDIHLEPELESVRLRYRLDGVLHDIMTVTTRLYPQLLSRIKLISGLKLNVRANAQDGRFSIRLKNTEIEIRTSVLPSAYGESIVLRILNPEAIAVTFETLGIESYLFTAVEKQITKPNGLILLTGPTGSGKTTTLYAFLRRISTTENKIITIEDPIEYHLTGINQTQVNPEKQYTFLSGLRSALRQDPDIIMVGEIRDAETATIAVNAALTGHLVLSTLHTNNAAGTIPRLIDLGVNPKIIDAALNISIAQRLVRTLCPACRQPSQPTRPEQELLDQVVLSIKKKRPDLGLPTTQHLWRAAEGGCSQCHHTGYRGRQGVFEAVLMDERIAKILTDNPNERDIRIASIQQKILDMRQDGVLKVLKGSTTLEEVGRVIDLGEEILELAH